MSKTTQKKASFISKISTFYKAVVLNHSLWRVTYKSGKSSDLLSFNEATKLKEAHGGHVWIDYTTKNQN